MKKTWLVSCCALIVSTTLSYAQPHNLMPGTSMEFNLAPGTREEFTNFSFYTVNAKCNITSEDKDGDDFFVEVLRKKGIVDGLPLSAGDNVIIHVHDQEILKISAESGGKVALTNLGEHPVKAMCTA
jgi:hypothetical protein